MGWNHQPAFFNSSEYIDASTYFEGQRVRCLGWDNSHLTVSATLKHPQPRWGWHGRRILQSARGWQTGAGKMGIYTYSSWCIIVYYPIASIYGIFAYIYPKNQDKCMWNTTYMMSWVVWVLTWKMGWTNLKQSILEGKFQWILVVTPSWNNSHRKHGSDVSPFRWNWRCISALERRSGVPEGIRTSWSWFTTTLQGRKRWRKEQQWGVNTKMTFTVFGPLFVDSCIRLL